MGFSLRLDAKARWKNSTQVTDLSGSLCIDDSLVRTGIQLECPLTFGNILLLYFFITYLVLNSHRYISLQVVLIGFKGL